ncbi:hypothetical protein [Paenibacillus taichungensis]
MNNDHLTKLSAIDLLSALQELKGIKFEVTVGIASQEKYNAD